MDREQLYTEAEKVLAGFDPMKTSVIGGDSRLRISSLVRDFELAIDEVSHLFAGLLPGILVDESGGRRSSDVTDSLRIFIDHRARNTLGEVDQKALIMWLVAKALIDSRSDIEELLTLEDPTQMISQGASTP